MAKNWEATKEKYYSTIEQEFGPTKEISEILVKMIQRRLELGMTQKELAERSGLKQSAVARMENFAVLPRLDTLIKAFRILGLRLTVTNQTKEDIYDIVIERAERIAIRKENSIYKYLLESKKINKSPYHIDERRDNKECKKQLVF